MVGNGKNRKSMAYVGNVAIFLEASLGLDSGIHVFNYADKPDMTTWEVVNVAKAEFGQAIARTWSIPYALGLTAGYILDGVAFVCRKKFSVSAIRIKKFCADTTVSTAKVERSGFKAPYTLEDGLRRTIAAEFPVPADRSC